jgi:hypothetical protein
MNEHILKKYKNIINNKYRINEYENNDYINKKLKTYDKKILLINDNLLELEKFNIFIKKIDDEKIDYNLFKNKYLEEIQDLKNIENIIIKKGGKLKSKSKKKTKNKRTRKIGGRMTSALNTNCEAIKFSDFANIFKWPKMGGCIQYDQGHLSKVKMFEGTILDRFGKDTGGFLGIPEDSYTSRSIPYIVTQQHYNNFIHTHNTILNNSNMKYHQYKVQKPFYTYVCIASPINQENIDNECFHRPGGAMQFAIFLKNNDGNIDYTRTISINTLIEKGYLEEIPIPDDSLVDNFPKWE